jgi:short-subunit dehydrogenase
MEQDVFRDKWTLITGASSGFGADFARQLAAKKANLILSARSQDKLEALATELRATHQVECHVVTGDLAVADGAVALAKRVDALNVTLEHVINNAGFGLGGAFVTRPADKTVEMLRVNCEALTTLTAWWLPKMVERNSGGFLQVASVAGFQPTPYVSVYGATKAYVVNMTAGLAEELRDTNVRMCALCPGPVETGFQATAGIQIAPQQKASVLSSEQTVRLGIEAYLARKTIYVPGVVNKLGGIASKLLPRSLVARFAGDVMKHR